MQTITFLLIVTVFATSSSAPTEKETAIKEMLAKTAGGARKQAFNEQDNPNGLYFFQTEPDISFVERIKKGEKNAVVEGRRSRKLLSDILDLGIDYLREKSQQNLRSQSNTLPFPNKANIKQNSRPKAQQEEIYLPYNFQPVDEDEEADEQVIFKIKKALLKAALPIALNRVLDRINTSKG